VEVELPAMSEDEYIFVVVELVVVELSPVKFWRVDEPVTKRLESVVCPEVTPRVPGKI
jgi:hypothetical protein